MTTSHQSNAPTVATPTVRTLAEMISAGHYDWTSLKIDAKLLNSGALVLGRGPRLFAFDRAISQDDAIVKMDKEGCKPGSIGDLLAFGANCPEDQREHAILTFVKIGSLQITGLLDGLSSRRGLILEKGFNGNIHPSCRILCVRK